MMASTGMGVWVLEKRTACGWEYCDTFSKPDNGQKDAPNFHPYPAEIRWDNTPFSSYGFFGQASVAAFRLRLVQVK